MKIATWNVNSLRVRLPQVFTWLDAERPDVLALQETKVVDADFPVQDFAGRGYAVSFSGQKTYNGVAVASTIPLSGVVTAIPGLDDPQKRVLYGRLGEVGILNLYVPNGSEVDSEKYRYKLDWLHSLRDFIAGLVGRDGRLVVLGDFNIAPTDADVHDPDTWREKILCSTPEREAFAALVALGLEDCFRRFPQPEQSYSWWDYRAAGFRRNLGLRIDHILAGTSLADACTACRIDRGPRGWERPSDHAPVVAVFAA